MTVLTIGAVSAVGNTSDDTNNGLENVESVTDDNSFNMAEGETPSTNSEMNNLDVSDEASAQYTDKGLSEELALTSGFNGEIDFGSTFNNLDYLISCSDDYALLNQSFTFSSAQDMDYVNGIKINGNNLIIDGNDHIIDGSSHARMFNVTGNNITFKNIVFVNGASENGGVLYITGNNVKLVNCTFMDNHVANFGGAVYSNSTDLDIIDCSFKNNNATSGGAI
ncbi:hypothetical protein PXD04_08015 [Methanosphaera sp. ISO3-F5]|uniref:hypothetical protein n=1 Tax=Methanosphaera sp. ISO3-F5 TaxID=1452353 RepID=UPI002B261F50|nr:hypothetical protein [Methanosphaera sp. ISO3-F5]WQH63640.1 hypothetical protein PXD04_08015 [Methanosphaera sp. ISO3-F5]